MVDFDCQVFIRAARPWMPMEWLQCPCSLETLKSYTETQQMESGAAALQLHPSSFSGRRLAALVFPSMKMGESVNFHSLECVIRFCVCVCAP